MFVLVARLLDTTQEDHHVMGQVCYMLRADSAFALAYILGHNIGISCNSIEKVLFYSKYFNNVWDERKGYRRGREGKQSLSLWLVTVKVHTTYVDSILVYFLSSSSPIYTIH